MKTAHGDLNLKAVITITIFCFVYEPTEFKIIVNLLLSELF